MTGRGRILRQSGIAAFAGGLLGVCFLYSGLFLVAWVALVPWLVTLKGASPGRAYGLGLIFGVCLLIAGSSWIAPFIDAISHLEPWQGLLVAVLYWLVSAQAFAALGVLLAVARNRLNWPFALSLPVFGTLAFELLPYIFPLNLGITQVDFPLSLQATDVTGPAGMAIVILLVNAVVADAADEAPHRSSFAASVVLTGAVMLGWFGYGIHTLGSWESAQAGWTEEINLGVVQTNAPAVLSIPPPEPGYSYSWPPEMAFYEHLAGQGAQLVIWPETRFKGYHAMAHVRASFTAYVQRYGAGLLLQDLQEDQTGKTFNTAVFLGPAGADQIYRKSRLIAFGETTPGEGFIPGMSAMARQVFGDFHTPLAAGDTSPFFHQGETAWIPLICYEVAFAPFVAAAVSQSPRQPQWISVQSNDVWFSGTRQPLLHIAVSRMRAVENRLPLVHVINNGPSVVIAPTGRVTFQTVQHQRRGYLLQLAVPAGGQPTFYNQYPLLVPRVVAVLALGMLALMAWSIRTAGERPATVRRKDRER